MAQQKEHAMSRRRFLLASATTVCVAAWGPARADKPPAAKLGKPAPAFKVADTGGQVHTLAELKGKTAVLEWTSTSCPFAAAQYESGRMPELQRWAIGKGV